MSDTDGFGEMCSKIEELKKKIMKIENSMGKLISKKTNKVKNNVMWICGCIFAGIGICADIFIIIFLYSDFEPNVLSVLIGSGIFVFPTISIILFIIYGKVQLECIRLKKYRKKNLQELAKRKVELEEKQKFIDHLKKERIERIAIEPKRGKGGK